MKTMLLILAVAVLGVPASAQTAGNVAYRDANVRITMIDDGAARLEYAPNGKFVDDKSQVAVIRDYAPVSYKVSDKSKTVRISTNEMTITYVKGKGPFTSAKGKRHYAFLLEARTERRWQPERHVSHA